MLKDYYTVYALCEDGENWDEVLNFAATRRGLDRSEVAKTEAIEWADKHGRAVRIDYNEVEVTRQGKENVFSDADIFGYDPNEKEVAV